MDFLRHFLSVPHCLVAFAEHPQAFLLHKSLFLSFGPQQIALQTALQTRFPFLVEHFTDLLYPNPHFADPTVLTTVFLLVLLLLVVLFLPLNARLTLHILTQWTFLSAFLHLTAQERPDLTVRLLLVRLVRLLLVRLLRLRLLRHLLRHLLLLLLRQRVAPLVMFLHLDLPALSHFLLQLDLLLLLMDLESAVATQTAAMIAIIKINSNFLFIFVWLKIEI